MANIFERFATIMKANINDLLDKAEDPEKMIDQYMREMGEQLAEVKMATAGVMAEETRTKRDLDDNAAEVARFDGLARKALEAGNEDDARQFLAKKQSLEAKGDGYELAYATAHENAEKMRQMHDKLVSDMEQLSGRREMIKSKVAVAKAQEKVNKFAGAGDKAAGTMDAFARMEAKADAMLDTANAMNELNEKPVDAAEEVAKKYEAAGTSAAVDDELARLKAEMGIGGDKQ